MNKDSSNHFTNRELSWVEFNNRVLEEAQDEKNPLLERLKFLSIVSSNMDEFFMVRVASLWDQKLAGFEEPDPSGLTPIEQIKKITDKVHKLVYNQYDCFNESIIPLLKKEKILFLKNKDLTEYQSKFIEKYFLKNIYPVLTPMVVDKSRPFPLILNKSLNIALLLENIEIDGDTIFATIQVPTVLNRLIEIPSEKEERSFIYLEEVIKRHIDKLFSGHKIICMGDYRITRNADLSVDEEGAEDLLEAIEESIKLRKWGNVIRLEVEKGLDTNLLKRLKHNMEIPEEGLYEILGPLDLTFLMKFTGLSGYNHLRYPQFKSHTPSIFKEYKDIYKAISENEILLHHPFDSFDSIIDLVQKSANDPNVLAIKQTLYRVSGNSPIVQALAQAAENGKQVTVLVEIKARFDEENNINWAKKLEESGCHVIYGLVGLKTHCKILLIVRKEEDGIKRYVHMGTGNYNDVTAKFYTDIGLLTTNPYIGSDVSSIFNRLTGYSSYSEFYKVHLAPGLGNKFIELIEQEAKLARQGKKAHIIAKMNSLVDEEVIQALYKASTDGVQIDLIVRGICCLKPNIPEISENIRVRSIIGRFLEHSRIFYFHNDGNQLVYLSSADWMPRNLKRRVELLFPVEDQKNRNKIKKILDIYLQDNQRARVLNHDGSYSRINKRGKESIDSQAYFHKIEDSIVTRI